MVNIRITSVVVLLVLFVLGESGCRRSKRTDDPSELLHHASSALTLYQWDNGVLPPSLEALAADKRYAANSSLKTLISESSHLEYMGANRALAPTNEVLIRTCIDGNWYRLTFDTTVLSGRGEPDRGKE